MTSVVNIINQALNMIGEQTQVSSIDPSDGSPAANVAATLYQTKADALMRAAPWGFATKQVYLTPLRSVISSDGSLSLDPPPQPWQYEYGYPSDCIRARAILPRINYASTSPSGTVVPLTTATTYDQWGWANGPIPFKIALDLDPSQDNDIKVILTNVFQAQLIYTKRVEDPNLWDPSFTNALTCYLAVWFVNALGRNTEAFRDQIRIANDIVATARSDDGNEGSTTVDNTPDWIRIRGGPGPTAVQTNGGWDRLLWPGGGAY